MTSESIAAANAGRRAGGGSVMSTATDWAPGNRPSESELIGRFKAAMKAAGIETKDIVEADGELHRIHVEGDRPHSRNGWYVLNLDRDLPSGAFGSWKLVQKATWCLKAPTGLTPAERITLRTQRRRQAMQRAQADVEQRAEARKRAQALWERAGEASPAHPYLVTKTVSLHGLRQDGDQLMVPILDFDDILHGLQFIGPDGAKKFLTGSAKRAHFYRIGMPNDVVLICEGYATGATVREATEYAVMVAFDRGNLRPVAEAARKQDPKVKIIIAADNDRKTEGNPGIAGARSAANVVGGFVAVPEFLEDEDGSDFNDLARHRGAEAVRAAIEAVVTGGTHDPLDSLIEATATDPGAPFAPDALAQLAALKKDNRAAFEALRAHLKKAGCRMTALNEAIAEENGDMGGRGTTQADILIDLAGAADLFHSADGTAFADLDINGHRETWTVRTKGFRRWLARQFFEATGGAPSSEALRSALNVIEAKAHFDAPKRVVHIRVGGLDGRLYLDLGDEKWRAVEIDGTGWRVVDNPPVRFRRAAGMQALPIPAPGGSVETLRTFLNVHSDTDFVLVVAWALACLRNRGPYPVIVLSGEQGSAKSTFSAILRSLLDPNTAPLRALPREDRDLFIAANNGHVLAFDNVSGLPGWISDTLCRLATGGGFAVRQLYTDQDEVLFDAARPVVLNGIEDIVTRPDLADRAIFLTLEPIPEERRRPEKELWAAFETVRPQILGALLDAVSAGLRRLPETRLEKLPRMADFALWATACGAAIWEEGTFLRAYAGNRDEAVDSVIEADPVGSATRSLMESRTEWTGTASVLLGALSEEVGERIAKTKTWPATARALSGRLRRTATFLRKVGVDIEFNKEGRARTRIIRICCTADNAGTVPSRPSAPSAEIAKAAPGNGSEGAHVRTVEPFADANGGTPVRSTVRENTGIPVVADGADDADANIPEYSGGWRKRI